MEHNGFQGNREFLIEVMILGHLNHPNLVNLVGYCSDGDQRLLAYEYMALGSLADHLLGKCWSFCFPQLTHSIANAYLETKKYMLLIATLLA